MSNRSPFFAGFHRRLFGRKPVSGERKKLAESSMADQLCRQQLVVLFGHFIGAKLLDFKTFNGVNSRCRIFSVPVTFWAFLGQVLDSGSSCRKAVCRVQTLFSLQSLPPPAEDTSAYCSARRRLPVRWLCRLNEAITSRLSAVDGRRGRLLVVDGTSTTLCDTPSLQSKYPQPSSQKPGCGFPLINILGLFDLRSGAWLASAKGHADNHDLPLFRRLYRRLRKGDTVVADRAFCSWFDIAVLRAKGVDVVMRLHQARKVDFNQARRLGKGDYLVQWSRVKCPRWMNAAQYALLPQEMEMRVVVSERVRPGWRTTKIYLATTLLEVTNHPLEKVAHLYSRRWQIELNFDTIKTTMQMETLRTKSPALVCRELLMHMIAYNLIRSLAQRAGVEDVDTMSFKGSLDRINSWSGVIWSAPNQRQSRFCVESLLESIRVDIVKRRPGRREPRAVKRRPGGFQLLTRPRHEMREIPHRSGSRNQKPKKTKAA